MPLKISLNKRSHSHNRGCFIFKSYHLSTVSQPSHMQSTSEPSRSELIMKTIVWAPCQLQSYNYKKKKKKRLSSDNYGQFLIFLSFFKIFFPYYSLCTVKSWKSRRREDEKLCVKEERNGCFPMNYQTFMYYCCFRWRYDEVLVPQCPQATLHRCSWVCWITWSKVSGDNSIRDSPRKKYKISHDYFVLRCGGWHFTSCEYIIY